MRHPFPSPTPRLIRVAPPLSDLCGVFWDSYCFCVATCGTTGLVPVCQDCCLISGWHDIIHGEGTRNWENVEGFIWSVRGFSNTLRVVDKSVVCISVRVEESPIDTLLLSAVYVCLSALATLCARSEVTIHVIDLRIQRIERRFKSELLILTFAIYHTRVTPLLSEFVKFHGCWHWTDTN